MSIKDESSKNYLKEVKNLVIRFKLFDFHQIKHEENELANDLSKVLKKTSGQRANHQSIFLVVQL